MSKVVIPLRVMLFITLRVMKSITRSGMTTSGGVAVYKLLLCWRYLRTRYLALVCIISVMLGVATLIVVNSVMSGFSTKLRDRLHSIVSLIIIEVHVDGCRHPEEKIARVRSDPYLSQRISAIL